MAKGSTRSANAPKQAKLANVDADPGSAPSEAAPDVGEAAPDDGEAAPDDGEVAPDDGEAAPDDARAVAARAAAYAALCGKVDAFFARVQAAAPGQVTCGAGCAKCCQSGLSVTVAEAERLAAVLSAYPSTARAALLAHVRASASAQGREQGQCGLLDPSGRCLVYDGRPLVCRSHGVPVKFRDARSLPVLTVCELNFVGQDLAGLPTELVLDQATLSALLLAVNQGLTERFDLLGLVEELLAADADAGVAATGS